MTFDPNTRGDADGPAAEPETTGRFLVMMEPDEIRRGTSEMSAGAGLRLGSSGDFVISPASSDLSDSEGVVFADLGIAVVNADPDQVDALRGAEAKSAVLRVVEPERVVHAIGEVRIDASYLVGYRDAVDDLVVRLLGAEAGRTSGAAALVGDELSWGLSVRPIRV